MLNDEVLEKILLHPNMSNYCLYQQTEIIKMVDDVFKQIKEERPYATISELLCGANANV